MTYIARLPAVLASSDAPLRILARSRQYRRPCALIVYGRGVKGDYKTRTQRRLDLMRVFLQTASPSCLPPDT